MDGTAKGAQRKSVYTGIVRSVSPLTVETSGILLTAEDIWINEQVLSQSNAVSLSAVKGNLTGQCSGCTGSGSVSFAAAEGSGTATITQAGRLTVGCRVVLITADTDKFILLCKVVQL